MIPAAPHRRRDVLVAGLVCAGLAAGLAAGAACGKVQFVRSPYAIRDLSVTYSVQENVTLFAWKLGANVDLASVRFESWWQGAWTPVRFDEAPFPAGAYECGQDTCYRWTIPGRYTIPDSGLVLRSLHPHHGIQHAAPVSLHERDVTLSFTPRLRPGNTQLDLGVDDLLSEPGTPLRRRFRWVVTPHAESCAPATGAWDGTTAGQERVRFDQVLTDEGAWCVTLSPEARGIDPVSLATAVVTHPQLAWRTHTYVPGKQTAPVVYQLILDLEIPNESRCASTIDLFEQTFSAALRKRSGTAHALPTVNLSSVPGGCRQEPMRRLPVAEIAETAKAYVRQAVHESEGTRIVFVYANNLAFPLPSQLSADFDLLVEAMLQEPRAKVMLSAWAFAPVLVGVTWQEPVSWVPPSDRLFGDTVKAFAETILPFQTMLHTTHTAVSFVDPELEKQDGLLKLCSSTPKVYMTDGTVVVGKSLYPVGPGWVVRYRTDLGEQKLVRHSEYVEHEVKVGYEVCTRWCTHPFRTPRGEWLPNWSDTSVCWEGS